MNKPSKVLLVGSGRLAKHLIQWNSLLKVPNSITQFGRNKILKSDIEQADLIWLAVSDSAIESVYQESIRPNLKSLNEKNVIHFSGARHFSELISAHPLMSFGNQFYSIETYKQIHFTITGANSLAEVMPGFENHFTIITAEQKPLYHALCVLAGNFPQMLWAHTQKEFRRLGIEDSSSSLYIKQISDNYLQYGEAALTGPHIRGDIDTINKNTASLNEIKSLQKIYQAFTEGFSKGSLK